jgi:hypothetical protein
MLMGSPSSYHGHPSSSKLQTGRRRCLRLTSAPLSILARLTAVPARGASSLAPRERRRRPVMFRCAMWCCITVRVWGTMSMTARGEAWGRGGCDCEVSTLHHGCDRERSDGSQCRGARPCRPWRNPSTLELLRRTSRDPDMDQRHAGNGGSTDRARAPCQGRIMCPRQRNRACLAGDRCCTRRGCLAGLEAAVPGSGSCHTEAPALAFCSGTVKPTGPAWAEADTRKRAYGSMARCDMSL